jgi:hypothetical protein
MGAGLISRLGAELLSGKSPLQILTQNADFPKSSHTDPEDGGPTIRS